jgi:hypothetical protein
MCRGGWYEAGDNKPTDLGKVGQNLIVRSNILTHFIKEIFSLTPMETFMNISKDLEYLEGLLKLDKKQKDAENTRHSKVFPSQPHWPLERFMLIKGF